MVQPLLISGLLFALLLRRRQGRPVTGHEVRWALVLTVCLIAFLFLAGTNPAGRPIPDRTGCRPWSLPASAGGRAGLPDAGPPAPARRGRGGVDGVAVGVVYAASAALLKGFTDRAVHGPLAALTSWQLYAVIVVGAIGLFLSQLAFQAGPLTASLPAIATVDPLLSIVVGVMVYDEHIHRGPWSGAGLLVILMLLLGRVGDPARQGGPRGTGQRMASSRRPGRDCRPVGAASERRYAVGQD